MVGPKSEYINHSNPKTKWVRFSGTPCLITIIPNKTIHIYVATIMTFTVITTIMTIIVLTSFVTIFPINQTYVHVTAIVEILVCRACTAILVVKVTCDISAN